MEGKNIRKIYRLFDYFKTAYKLNTSNKCLYRPQIIFSLLKGGLILTLMLAATFIGRNMFTTFNESIPKSSYSPNFGLFITFGVAILVVILFLFLASNYFEAGMYYMYFKAHEGSIEKEDFNIGAKKYFGRFLGGNLLIALFWMVALVFYIVLGFVTLGIGFTLIPVIISALLMVWKVIIVKTDMGTIEAIKVSLAFGKENLIPASILIIIQNTVSGAGSSGGGGGGGYNNFNTFSNIANDGNSSGFTVVPSDAISIFTTIFVALSAVITIVVIVTALIQMIFNVFFGLVYTVIYLDGWSLPEESMITEETEVKEVSL